MLKYLILHYLVKCNYHHARNTQNNIRHAPIKKRRIPITVHIFALLTNPPHGSTSVHEAMLIPSPGDETNPLPSSEGSLRVVTFSELLQLAPRPPNEFLHLRTGPVKAVKLAYQHPYLRTLRQERVHMRAPHTVGSLNACFISLVKDCAA